MKNNIGKKWNIILASLLYQTYGCFYLTILNVGSDSVLCHYSLDLIGELGVLSEDYCNLKSNNDYSKNLKACIKRRRMIQKSLPIGKKNFWFFINMAGDYLRNSYLCPDIASFQGISLDGNKNLNYFT